MVWKQNPKEIKAVQCNHSIDYHKNMQWDMQQGHLQIYKINFGHRITQTVPEKWRRPFDSQFAPKLTLHKKNQLYKESHTHILYLK